VAQKNQLTQFGLIPLASILIGFIIAVAISLLVLQPVTTSRHGLSLSNAYADSLQQRLDINLARIILLSSRVSNSSQLAQLMADNDTAKISTQESELAAIIPHAMKVRLFRLEEAEVDRHATPIFSYTSLDLVNKAESGAAANPEAINSDGQWIVNVVTPIRSSPDEQIAGTLFVYLKLESLLTGIRGDIEGELKLVQTVGSTTPVDILLIDAGKAQGVSPLQRDLNNPNWTLHFTPSDKFLGAGVATWIEFLYAPMAFLLVAFLGVYLGIARGLKILKTDISHLDHQIASVASGRFEPSDAYKIGAFTEVESGLGRLGKKRKTVSKPVPKLDVQSITPDEPMDALVDIEMLNEDSLDKTVESDQNAGDSSKKVKPRKKRKKKPGEKQKVQQVASKKFTEDEKVSGSSKIEEVVSDSLEVEEVVSESSEIKEVVSESLEVDEQVSESSEVDEQVSDSSEVEVEAGESQKENKEETEPSAEAEGASESAREVEAREASEITKQDYSSIFRAYDIRGIADETLTPDLIHKIGLAIGSEAKMLGQQALLVGADGRLSSPKITAALIAGLRESGRDVIDIGSVPTPVLYYATHNTDTRSGVMVTGSHNSSEYNGFKIVLDGRTLIAEDIQKLYQRIQNNEFYSGDGNLTRIDIRDKYLDAILDDIVVAQPLKVAVDCGNGIAGDILPGLLSDLGCDVVPLYCDVDGHFPNHPPDPIVPENLEDLILTVKSQEADIGIALDGDGDRLVAISKRGEIIWPDRLLMLFAKDVVSRNPGCDVVYDIKSTRHLNSVISGFGGRPILCRSGHSYIKEKMAKTDAILGGEMSGHICFAERWFGFDDGLYAAARLLELVASQEEGLDELLEEFPSSLVTPEIQIKVDDQRKFQIIDQLNESASFKGGTITTVDGIRVDYAEGWGLVRASNTNPVLTLRFEATNDAAMARIKNTFRTEIQAVQEDLDFE